MILLFFTILKYLLWYHKFKLYWDGVSLNSMIIVFNFSVDKDTQKLGNFTPMKLISHTINIVKT